MKDNTDIKCLAGRNLKDCTLCQSHKQPKRSPLPDNTLPLTEEEIKTVEEMTGMHLIGNVAYTVGKLRAVLLADSQKFVIITNVKAILWLAERFELTMEG